MSKSDRNHRHTSKPRREMHSDYRRLARTLTLQALYQLTVQRGENLDQIAAFLQEFGRNEKERALARQWIEGTWHHLQEIDAVIQEFSDNWDIKRLSQVDHSNLRLAVYELMFCPDIPAKVVINEAIELAKVFGSMQSGGFINGLLDRINKKLHQQGK